MTAHRFIKIISAALLAAMIFAVALLCACGFQNPGDSLGGGGSMDSLPQESCDALSSEARKVAGDIETAKYSTEEDVKAYAQHATDNDIESAGDWYIEGDELKSKKININSDGVTLYLLDASLGNDGKAIESEEYGLTLTLIGDSEISCTTDKTAVDVAGELTINGPGSLKITSEKNGVKANSIKVTEATLIVDAAKDALHAEIDSYDDVTEEPEFSYSEGGFVYIDGATLELVSGDDGIQADTFVYIAGSDTDIDIVTNGGAPSTVTEKSSDAADGKGIKAGTIDWGDEDLEIDSSDYLILIDDGTVAINSNDDAIHSNGTIVINGGTFDIETGDDGIHSDDLLLISDGDIKISKCYEGIESEKVEISGGDISVSSTDDGINAANKNSSVSSGKNDPECHVIISGGEIYVDAEGDGIDSNGTMLISGGEVYVSGSTSSNDAALDSNGGIAVNGGSLFACGALGMVETPSSSSTQFVVSYANGSKINAGTILYLVDSDGDILMEYEVPKSCQSVIVSCSELEKGESYSIYGGDSKLATFTISSTITSVGSTASIPNGSGRPSGSAGGSIHQPSGRR